MYTSHKHFIFHLLSKHREYIPSKLQVVEKQVLKEPNSVLMIDVRAAKLSDCSYPIAKSSNWTAVIGYPRDRATITQQIGTRRTNHERAFCYRYDYHHYNIRMKWVHCAEI